MKINIGKIYLHPEDLRSNVSSIIIKANTPFVVLEYLIAVVKVLTSDGEIVYVYARGLIEVIT